MRGPNVSTTRDPERRDEMGRALLDAVRQKRDREFDALLAAATAPGHAAGTDLNTKEKRDANH